MFKNKVDIIFWTFDKPMDSLSNCHLSLCYGWLCCSILLNLIIVSDALIEFDLLINTTVRLE